jgi:hypothetical protein
MKAVDLAAIDWTAPWLAPYCEVGRALAASDDWRGQMNLLAAQKSLRNFRGQPISFIPQQALPAGVPYEAHIGSTGQIPTRPNLHDFFNGLVWLHFPLVKARLNQLQFEQLQGLSGADQGHYRVGNVRGRVRDAATVFDENGALLLCGQSDMAERLREHDWSIFVERRAEFCASCRVILFGHALMEKLVQPYASITAHWVLTSTGHPLDSTNAQIDAVARFVFEADLTTAAYSPLPVFGVPGWASGQDRDFYSDASVFRPKRRPRN